MGTPFGFYVVNRKPLSTIRYHCPICGGYDYVSCHANLVENQKAYILIHHNEACHQDVYHVAS